MRTKRIRPLAAALVLLSTFNPQLSTCLAQGTAFTDQGRRNDAGGPANGSYDLQFAIYDSTNLPGTMIAGPLTNSAISVRDGLFAVTLDFGANVFTSADRWLDISVRTNGGSTFATLDPRQQLKATPYSIFAQNVGPNALLPGTYASAVTFNNPGNSFSGSFAGDGANVTNVNAAALNGVSAGSFWQLGGNNVAAGQFLGSTNLQPVTIAVNGLAAWRLMPAVDTVDTSNIVNLVGGSALNYMAPGAYGSVIVGGGAANYFDVTYSNSVSAEFSFLGGGANNSIQTGVGYSFLGGGFGNSIQTNAHSAFLGGGENNAAGGQYSAVGGGSANIASGMFSTVPGGEANFAAGDYSFAAGAFAQANHKGSFVWARSQGTSFCSTTNDQYSIRAKNGVRLNNDTSLFFGSGGMIWADQGGSIELGNSRTNFSLPYIDFHYGLNSNQDFNVRLINDVNGQLTLNGNESVTGNEAVNGTLTFGSQTREMINLYRSGLHSIGVQNLTTHVRRSSRFSWFMNGVHANGENDAGGGTVLMTLNSGGLTVNGTLVSTSDRNTKENFEPVDSREVLAKVVALPVEKWNYKTDGSTRHLGPMAQDFYAAFGVGPDDKHIATVDEGGVALAAIQGLNQKLSGQEAVLKEKVSEIQQLRQAVAALQKIVSQITHKTQEQP